MNTAVSTPTGARGAIGRCRNCSIVLPLRWPADNETPEEWACANCGERYRGIRIQNLPKQFARNVCPAGSTSVELKAGEVDGQDESLLCPTLPDPTQPHPITIAFPDRPKIICELENSFSRMMDQQICQPGSLLLPQQTFPFADNVSSPGIRPYDRNWIHRILDQVVQSAREVDEQFASLKEGRAAEVRVFRAVIQDQLRQIVEDKDIFACLSMRPHEGEYPAHHALQTSMLAMSIGLVMGWDEATLIDLGVGCLIHDAGMLCVGNSRHQKKGILAADDLVEIAKHSVVGLGAVEHRTGEISERALVVAYQIHERCNGSGYPRGYSANQIHPMARVAAIADVFVALLSPRPHRPGMVPYHAIKKIMQDTERGLFDREAFRSLLETVSVFPIGSFIALKDGRVGRVIRPNAGSYDRPIIEAWRRGNTTEPPVIIDLAEQKDIAIASSLARLDD